MIEDKVCDEFIISIIAAEKVTGRSPSQKNSQLLRNTAKKGRYIDVQKHAYKCSGSRSAYSFSLLHACHKWRFHHRMYCFCEYMVVRATMFSMCKCCTSSYTKRREQQSMLHNRFYLSSHARQGSLVLLVLEKVSLRIVIIIF